jgi:OOP family OmpA-OmpF porin
MANREKFIGLFCVIIFLFLATFSELTAESEGESEFKDTPYFSGMPNFRIGDSLDQEFADYNFFNGKDCTTVEGQKFFRAYTLKEDAKPSSELQISRNYSNAVKSMGGTVIFEGESSGVVCAENSGYRLMVGRVVKGNNELWLEICPFNGGNDYYLTLIVKEVMKQVVTSGDMLEALNKDGRFILNINFDAGLAILKPEYKPVISQIVEMMKANPELKISVEGHTDGRGTLKDNLALSENRAKAVMNEIVAQGIDPKRIRAVGYGPQKPIADINTEEGRAKNRRVEIVKD